MKTEDVILGGVLAVGFLALVQKSTAKSTVPGSPAVPMPALAPVTVDQVTANLPSDAFANMSTYDSVLSWLGL